MGGKGGGGVNWEIEKGRDRVGGRRTCLDLADGEWEAPLQLACGYRHAVAKLLVVLATALTLAGSKPTPKASESAK